MIRIFMPCLLLLFGFSAAAQTAAEQNPPVEQKASTDAKPAVLQCVYNSKNYGEGASVCVQKAAMQTCTVDNGKAVWVTVVDEKLSSCCTAPKPRLNKYQRAAIWNRRNIAREISPPTDSSPFCFYTNGTRFCE